MTISTARISFLGFSLLLAGCASSGLDHRPAVAGGDLAYYERDLNLCQQEAASNKSLDNTEESGLLGAAAGAIVGAMADDSLEGAVVGALIGVASGKVTANQKQRDYIIKCMQDLGYNVVADAAD